MLDFSALNPRNSFRSRLLLVVLTLGIGLSQLASYLTHRVFTDQIRIDKGLLMAEIAHQMAGEMDKGIFDRLREIQIVAALPILSDTKGALSAKQALLEKLQDSYKNYAWIGITDTEGNILVGTRGILVGKSVAKRSWFVSGREHPSVGDVHDAFLLAKMLPKPEHDFLPLRLLDVSAPIYGPDGKFVGVICGHLSWDWSYQVKNSLLAPLNESDKTDILIVGKEGQILLGTPDLHQLTEKLELPSLKAAKDKNNGFMLEAWPDSKDYLTGYSSSTGYGDYPGLGWTVLVRQSTQDAFATAKRLQHFGELIGVAFAIVFALILWPITGRLTRPMRAIAAAAGQIKDGEYHLEIPVVEGSDEIAQLSTSLAELVAALESQRNDLAEKNKRLEMAAQVFSANTEGIVITDDQEKILSINAAFSEITGYAPDEVIGKTPRMLSSGQQDEAFYKNLWSSLKQTGRWQGEIWNKRKSGEVFPEWLIISRIKSSEDGRNYYIGIVTDITERKRSEEQIRKLAQAVEQSPESIVIANLDGEIEYVNTAFTRATGYDREEVIGKNPKILHSGKTPKATFESLWESLKKGDSWQGEFINLRKNGTEYIEHAIITPIRQENGSISHYVAVKEDITERKRMANENEMYRLRLETLVSQRTSELQQALVKADLANRSKGAFLANMSHEIRTPLNAITGLANLIKRSRLEPEQLERLNRLEAASDHLLSVINAILELSKIDAGKFELEEEPIQVETLIGNVISILRERVSAKGLLLKTEQGDVPKHLIGDATRLQQALLNFATNAVKFTPKGGGITLRCLVLEEKASNVFLRFEVEDTGIGISNDVIPKLFEAFEQADNSTTRQYGGTGLGLAINKKIAQLMHGSIGVESQLGVGSTFWFTARLGKGNSAQPVKPEIELSMVEETIRRRFSGQKVLLVEDEPVNCEIAEILLSDLGLLVEVAHDGREAFELTQSNEYALILMDMQMPVMGGIEATQRIRLLPHYRTRPIIAMTANAFQEDKEKCLEAGMNDFIGKPFKPAVLFSVLLRWLGAENSQT